ncbi:hypothetical protein LINGRAPRIM_LOCUS201 [Linum grandiflorum]
MKTCEVKKKTNAYCFLEVSNGGLTFKKIPCKLVFKTKENYFFFLGSIRS